MARRPKTLVQTLYQLSGIPPTVEAMFDVLDASQLDEIAAEVQPVSIAGAPGLWVAGQSERPVAAWCRYAAATVGLPVSYGDRRSAGLLMLAVDGKAYVVGYGGGHWLIPDERKEPRFGLRFTVRRLDPVQVQDLARRLPGARGRTDVTIVPGGLPVWSLGLEHAEIIGRLGGRSRDLKVTFSGDDRRPVRVEGSDGLRMRFGVDPADLVADIREISRVCADEKPHPALAFVDYISPVREPAIKSLLETELGRTLRADDASAGVVPVVPTPLINDFAEARSFRIKIGGARARLVTELEAADFLRRTRLQRPGAEVRALRDGRVDIFADQDGTDRIAGSSAIKWLEAVVSIDARRYFLLDGQWYEIDAAYLQTHADGLARLLTAPASLDLPPWEPGRPEREYNAWVPLTRPNYVCLDRHGIRGAQHKANGVEVCDLLAPGDELVHVKRAHGSAPLSHLFSQGLVAAEALLGSPEIRANFADEVRAHGKGRTIGPDFMPKKVVFAILLKDGEQLTADTLFPFSQVTLAHTASTLERRGVSVEVIGISAAGTPA